MKKMNLVLWLAAWLVSMRLTAATPTAAPATGSVIVAYVVSGSEVMPDPQLMTHINYAFGHVSKTFDGVNIDNGGRLRKIVELKRVKPSLKVVLSVGGWTSGRFSEMAADASLRRAFAKDCSRKVKEYGLDGIDIDWEYPTSSAAGISSSPADTDNFTLLMRDLRAALGKGKLLTLATVCDARFIDFPAILPYIDFVNVMAYDMGRAPRLHSGLYPSERTGRFTSSQAVEAHLKAGVPASRLVLGMPFYGRGGAQYADFSDFKDVGFDKSFRELWDETAKVPYLADSVGTVVIGFENPRSLQYKCRYILQRGLLGGMYWEYSCDSPDRQLSRTVYEALVERKPFVDERRHVLVLTEGEGRTKAFSDAALKWLVEESAVQCLQLQVLGSAGLRACPSLLEQADLVIQLEAMTAGVEEVVEHYRQTGRGGWIGFCRSPQREGPDEAGQDNGGKAGKAVECQVSVAQDKHPVVQDVPAVFGLPGGWMADTGPLPSATKVWAYMRNHSERQAEGQSATGAPAVWTDGRTAVKHVGLAIDGQPQVWQNKHFTRLLHNAIRWALAAE